jgi:hypothetical protein
MPLLPGAWRWHHQNIILLNSSYWCWLFSRMSLYWQQQNVILLVNKLLLMLASIGGSLNTVKLKIIWVASLKPRFIKWAWSWLVNMLWWWALNPIACSIDCESICGFHSIFHLITMMLYISRVFGLRNLAAWSAGLSTVRSHYQIPLYNLPMVQLL